MHSDFKRLLDKLGEDKERKDKYPILLLQVEDETRGFLKRMSTFIMALHKNPLIISAGLHFELYLGEGGFTLKVKNTGKRKSKKTAFITPCYFGELPPLSKHPLHEAALPVFIYTEYPEPEEMKTSYTVYQALYDHPHMMFKDKPELYRGKLQSTCVYYPSFDGEKLMWADFNNRKEELLTFDEIFEKVVAELVESMN